MTGNNCDIDVVKQKVNELTSNYYVNLLVVIDDVWHIEDAEPLVKAFSNCKTILTTRMNDIEQYIPSKQSVSIGPMTQQEAITLLTNEVIDSSQLSQEDVSLLEELAQDVHQWPLFLSLIRGQLSHYLKQYHFSFQNAIQSVQNKLHHKGLTPFNKITTNKYHDLAVEACVKNTLDLLTESLLKNIKSLILWTGIGTPLQIAVLHILWDISEEAAKDIIDKLRAYGLVKFTDIAIPPKNVKQQCVEVHSVVSQYILQCMDSYEIYTLSPVTGLKTAWSIYSALRQTFQQSYEVSDPTTLTIKEYLKFQLSEIENVDLQYFFRKVYTFAIHDPSIVLVTLSLKDDQKFLPCIVNLPMVCEIIDSLTKDCKQILKDIHIICRRLNQRMEKCLCKKEYDKLIYTLEDFIKTYPLCNVAQKAITKLKPYHSEPFVKLIDSYLQLITPERLKIKMIVLPYIKFYSNLHEIVSSSLLNGSPYIEMAYYYFSSGKFNEDKHLLHIRCFHDFKKSHNYTSDFDSDSD